jgi:hypothetical protein
MGGTLPEVTRTAAEWLQLIGIGILLGAMGQAGRSVIGLKKLNDEAADSRVDVGDLFSPSKLFISLLIGAISGAMASLFVIKDLAQLTTEQILGLAAAGYAGTDSVEALMSRMLPKTPALAAPSMAAIPAQVIAVQPAPSMPAALASDDYQG